MLAFAIRRVFEVELEPITHGGIGIAVVVENHEIHGTLAIVNVRDVPEGQRGAVQEKILRTLGRYPIRAEVRWENG